MICFWSKGLTDNTIPCQRQFEVDPVSQGTVEQEIFEALSQMQFACWKILWILDKRRYFISCPYSCTGYFFENFLTISRILKFAVLQYSHYTTMYRIQSFIGLLLGCFSPLSYSNQPIKLKMEESDDIEHTSINNFADISRNEVYVD